ncbi:hypothetical protein J7L48_04480 [bacterium]|nr:hypothetical protein [bacterium]
MRKYFLAGILSLVSNLLLFLLLVIIINIHGGKSISTIPNQDKYFYLYDIQKRREPIIKKVKPIKKKSKTKKRRYIPQYSVPKAVIDPQKTKANTAPMNIVINDTMPNYSIFTPDINKLKLTKLDENIKTDLNKNYKAIFKHGNYKQKLGEFSWEDLARYAYYGVKGEDWKVGTTYNIFGIAKEDYRKGYFGNALLKIDYVLEKTKDNDLFEEAFYRKLMCLKKMKKYKELKKGCEVFQIRFPNSFYREGIKAFLKISQ